MAKARVSVLGLGSMGGALAEGLIAAGHGVTVWNRSPVRTEPFAGRAAIAADAAGAIAASEIVVLCVLDHAGVGEVLGLPGVLPGLAGRTLVRFTGATPGQSRASAVTVEAAGGRYLDGSILTYPETIRSGAGQIVYSGASGAFESHRSLFEAWGEALFVGADPGTCFVLDKAVFVVLYGGMFSFLQAAALADAAGIAPEVYRRVAERQFEELRRIVPWFADLMARGDYSNAAASVRVSAEAYAPAAGLCRELGVDDLLPATLQALFDRALAEGRGENEMAACFEMLRRRRV
ncbi:MAG: NAD(P)-binding domain-containing protein [Proteobacteria bacterium]|nr:NAD(P)-binding domain-containing protein [Pseudomonadota bacterium]